MAAKKNELAVTDIQEQPMVVLSDTANLMSMIGRMATDPNADIDKMERLMRMKDEIDRQQARVAFAAAMSAAQADMPVILKNKKNNQTNSRYAELEVINDAITPVYTKHGFSLSFDTVPNDKEKWVTVRCRVRHVGGHTEESTYETPYDNTGMNGQVNKTTTHGLASGVTYARRYITIMVFNLTIKGEDNDGNTPKQDQNKAITEEQEIVLTEWIKTSGADKVKFLALYGIEKLSELPVKKYAEALAGLKQKAKLAGVK